MQLDTYVQQVHEQLAAAAALGDEDVRKIAATLANAASPAVRLAILNAVAEAADEITAALLDSPGAPAVAVRLDADEVRVAVTANVAGPALSPRADEGDASARISLRLSETLKGEIDDAATSAGVSVNAWLVQAATAALSSRLRGPHGLGSAWGYRNANHVTGWIND